jgi:hypothetical protein
VHVVAIIKLGPPIEAEAAALAKDLDLTPYEARLMLNGGLPAIVYRTPDAQEAAKLVKSIRARGTAALSCDVATIVGADRMIPMRHFAFEPDALVVTDRKEKLPYADIVALLRATHRTRTETEAETKNKKFSMGRALLSGGLMLTKTVAKKERSVVSETEHVLYLFRASGAVPWILRERAANYAALGSELAPSSAQNFLTTIRRLRELAPEAAYDESLMAPRAVTGRVARTATGNTESISMSSASGVDLLAHLIARTIGEHPPYR